jgi:hypothetical protein
MQLEDRCLPSFTPMLPPQGTMQDNKDGLNSVVYAFPQDPNKPDTNLPAAKLVTIMNNSSNVIFPVLYGSNTTVDNTAGTVVRAVITSAGDGYSGTYDVTFSSGSGLNPVAATGTAEGNGGIYSVKILNPGSGYLPSDQGKITATLSRPGAPPPKTNAVITAVVSQVTQNGVVSRYDPKDPLTNTYRGYIGEIDPVNQKQYDLGLQPGHQVTVQVPIAFWDGGRIYMVSNGSVPLTTQFDAGYPLQANAEWSYNPLATQNDLQKLGKGLSYIVAPSKPGDMPLYGADFADPTTPTHYANPNGVVMWYHELAYPGLVGAAAAHDFGHGVPAVLTEATFRDPMQPVIAPDMPLSEIDTIDNYDVSYVDSLGLPASMEPTLVPSDPPTPGSSQYTWLGSDLSTTDMQQSIASFTTNNTGVNTVSGSNPNGLGTYFGGLGWDQYYMPPDNNSTASGTIKQINNSDTNAPVTIITPDGGTAGLVNGAAVTISDVDGQNAINGSWVISNLTSSSFALVGIAGNNVQSKGGSWKAIQTTGVHVQKLPSGSTVIAESENANTTSNFDGTKYNFVSGGTQAHIDTMSTGVATKDQNTIQNVSTAVARQLVAGMLLEEKFPVGNPNTPFFAPGTTILSIQLGTTDKNDSTIFLSTNATASGANGSWPFDGSQYQSTVGSIAAGSTETITGLDPNVGVYLRPGMLVTGGGIIIPDNNTPPTYIMSISPDFTTITLTQKGTATGGSGPYTFVGGPASYVVQTLINNWYAWADYYVTQLASGAPAAAPTDKFQADTTANGGRADYNSLILKITDPNFDMNQLRIGDVVTSQGKALTPNSTGTSPGTPGYDPSLNYTIVNFDPTPGVRTVELSLPVAGMSQVSDTFTFAAPQYVARSSDAPAAAPTSISSIDNTTGPGKLITITAGTSGLANGMQVTIGGVTDQTTGLSATINGQWIITNVTGTSFQLQGSTPNGDKLSGGIWSTSGGTIPYTLNFNVPSASITGISNLSGKAITINTGSTVGLTEGQQITISGVTGQTAINGTWTVTNLTDTGFDLAGITGAVAGKGGPTGDGTPSSGGSWTPANALQFAQTVYDVMQTFSLLVDPAIYLSRSASLLNYIIGGNTGTFVINDNLVPGRHTLLPDFRTAHELRDELKSLLRGVYNFNAVPNQSLWYPNPATPTPFATLDQGSGEKKVTFGIYNLDPYVWFVHSVLHNSSYGFSFDDDVANTTANSSTLQIAVGGNAYTAPGSEAPNVLPNPETFSQGAPFGTQQSQGYIDTTSPTAQGQAKLGLTTISGLSQSAVARLRASDPKKDHPGSFITSDSAGLLPAGITVVNRSAAPSVTQAITGITNRSGETITIKTASTGNLGIGDLVTISDVNGQRAINGSWIVQNVVKDTSFDLDPAVITGNGVTSDGGTWTWNPSFVSFLTPTNWKPPTDHTMHQFTFSGSTGTIVPTNITPSVPQAPPGTVITINGKGLTGVYGVSFNGYPGTIVGSAITSITNTKDSPIVINVPAGSSTNGLTNGDTVTISGVIDQKTGKPAAINGSSFVIEGLVASTPTTPGSFTLTGNNSTGNGDSLSGGSWIDGTDSALKVIVPSFTPNQNGTTYPGPKGKIGVRNASGTNYSSDDFTIGQSAATRVAFVQQPTSGLAGAVISPPVTVQVQDASGKPVGGTFTVTIALGANPGGGVLGGTLTRTTDPSGLATFDDLTVSAPGVGYTLVASASGLTSVTSAAFDELSAAQKLAFVQGPTSGRTGAVISPPVTVQVVDTSGKPVGGTFTVTIALGANPGGGVLGGTLTRTTDPSGLATFDDLTISKPGAGYTLVASASGLPSVTSAAFDEMGDIPARASVAVFDPVSATWYIRDTSSPGAPDVPPFRYGAPTWTPLTGDWDGNGTSTVGVFDPTTATWYLRNSNSAGAPDVTPFAYGMAGWLPVVGDWDGNGTTTIGVVDPATMTWYLKNSNSPGAPDITPFRYGQVGDVPVVGDWDGNGTTTIGVWRPSTATWYLRNSNSPGAPDITPFAYGQQGDVPVTGDWDALQGASVGVFRPGTASWYLRNSNTPGAPDIGPFAYGGQDWLPVTGADATASLLEAAGGPQTGAAQAVPLSQADLDGVVGAALTRLQEAGVGGALLGRLSAAQFQVSDLPAGELGVAFPSANKVLIDTGAAGQGWFVDPTPLQDEEFTPTPSGALYAPAGTAAGDHTDLLTAVLHEMGHLAGLPDVSAASSPADLMGEQLGTGSRLTAALDRVFAQSPF